MENRLEYWINDPEMQEYSLLIDDMKHWLKVVRIIKGQL